MYKMGMASTSPARQSPYTEREMATFEVYKEHENKRQSLLRSGVSPEKTAMDESSWIQGGESQPEVFKAHVERVAHEFRNEWLLRLESLEWAFACDRGLNGGQQIWLRARLSEFKNDFKHSQGDIPWLVEQGAQLIEKQLHHRNNGL